MMPFYPYVVTQIVFSHTSQKCPKRNAPESTEIYISFISAYIIKYKNNIFKKIKNNIKILFFTCLVFWVF